MGELQRLGPVFHKRIPRNPLPDVAKPAKNVASLIPGPDRSRQEPFQRPLSSLPTAPEGVRMESLLVRRKALPGLS